MQCKNNQINCSESFVEADPEIPTCKRLIPRVADPDRCKWHDPSCNASIFSTLLTITSAVPSLRMTRYPDMSNDFSCAKANQAKQQKAFPSWSYDQFAPNANTQPIEKAWEPILEPVNGCNGLQNAWTKKFSFLVVLDASWVRYYNENSKHFANQGYHSLNESPNLLIDRVSYLFGKQFGTTLTPSNVVAFKDLGEACETNNKHVDDGSDRTSTLKHLSKAGISPRNTDAGIMRIGVGSYTPNQYCHSSAGIAKVCNNQEILVNQQKPFAPDGSGKINYRAIMTLAHEAAHFFGVCPASNSHCLNGHSINELADIQVWDGTPSVNARPQGMFRKFMTTCSPLYEDTLCKEVKAASTTCGAHTPPMSIVGQYIASKYGARTNDWHHVTITEVKANSVYKWKNRAGVSWTITRDTADPDLFQVGTDCPYYSRGYKTARIATKTTNGLTTATGIYGPWNELYTLKSELKPSHTVFCPFGNVDATCWADSAYQRCPYDRQGAYDAVLAKRTEGQDIMYKKYLSLITTGHGCTKA